MPLLRESVTHWPINCQSALIPSPPQELFFWSLFCRTDNVRESLELAEGTYLSHTTALIPLRTLRSLLALNTLLMNQGPAYRPATKRDTFSLSLLHACYWNKPYFVVLLKRSFVIHLCCLKYIVLGKLTNSRNAICASIPRIVMYIVCWMCWLTED